MTNTIYSITIALFLLSSYCHAQQQHINPHMDTLSIARYPLTHPEMLNTISDAVLKKHRGENRRHILQSLILNPNSPDSTLCKIAVFLLKQPAADEDILLTLVSHKNISANTATVISENAKDNKKLDILYRYCLIRINNPEK